MHILQVCFFLFLSSGQIAKFAQESKISNPMISLDTIKYLKIKSQILLSQKRYGEVYQAFSYIADFYRDKNDPGMVFDYKNKASICLSNFTDPCIALDTVYQLFIKYDKSNLNKTLLTESIINNFIENYTNKKCLFEKLKYLDFIFDSANCIIPETSRILLAKERIKISNRLYLPEEQYKSYYALLKLNLLPNEEILFEIELASLYHELKEYQLSNIILQKTICDKNLTKLDQAIILNLIGNNYLHLKKNSLSYHFFISSLSARNAIINNSELLRVIYNNIGNYFSAIGEMDSAGALYKKSLEISKKVVGYNSRETAFQLNNLGNHYYNIEKFDSAYIFYKESFDIKQELVNYKETDIIHSLYNLGRTQLKLNNTIIGISFLKESILKNFEIAKTHGFKNGLSSPDDFIVSTDILAETYFELFKKDKNHSLLDSAKIYFNKAVTTNDSIIYSMPIESSKILVNLANKRIIENYLECYISEGSDGYYPITDTLRILTLFDKCHNYILLNKFLEKDQNPQNSETSDLVNNKSIDELYSAMEIAEEDQSSRLKEQFELSAVLFEKFKNTKSNNKKYKAHYHLQNEEINEITCDNLIDSLTILIEYTTIKNFLYSLSISNNSIRINRIGGVHEISELITICNANLRRFSIDFNQLFNLSTILLAPLKNVSPSINKIIIIKDDNLLSIPFDALLLSKPEMGGINNTYLLNTYDISYSYSINLTKQKSLQVERKYNYDFIGFAPTTFYGDDQNYSSKLENSYNEIFCISKLFEKSNLKTLALSGPDANIDNFYNLADKTNILHISTHNILSGNSIQSGFILNHSYENPSDNLINYYDILNLSNSPELVILASCSSNTGKKFEGEGIQNIGRAFSIKGASFVISSLFRLDDEFSFKFMSVFYKKLLTTRNVKRSLCDTKRDFLNDKEYSYPTYWSNFNIIGK